MDGLHLVPVATGVSDFEAKLLAAQLGADGILWQMRGVVDSIYPFGGIDVLVPADQLDDARQVLALLAPSAAFAAGAPIGTPNGGSTLASAAHDERPSRWFAFAAAVAVLAVAMVRVLAVG